jgi:murein DD-endopeptidase MepM/ murein hydrolase activator NlpD
MRIVALTITMLMIVSLFPIFISPAAFAETTDQTLLEVQKRQEGLIAQIATLQKETDQLAASKIQVNSKLTWINGRSNEQKLLYQEKTLELTEALKEMAAANQAFIDASTTLTDKQNQYKKRLQSMFAHRQKSYFEIFIESGSLKNFFATIQFMSLVADSDQQMLDDLKASQDDAELKKESAQEQKEDMDVVVAEINAQIVKIKAEATTTQAQLQTIQSKLNKSMKAEDALNDESVKIGQEVRVLQQKIAAERSAKATAAAMATAAAKATAAAQNKPDQSTPSTVNKRGWAWPYPADHNIYSDYGWRSHPIYHVRRFHSGVDLGGTYGFPVVAARDGVVIMVRNPVEGRNTGGSGYGNYIVIAHDGEFSTLYGHLKSTLVKVGQEVNAGDRIGLCGSTGSSTGSHLHFEVMIDGSTTDPAPYIR